VRALSLMAMLTLSCYGLIGRTEAYFVNPNWNLSVPYESQEFWEVDLSYRKHFCRIENMSGGAAIRSDDTDTKPINSSFLRHTPPNAIRFERGYLAPPFGFVLFRWREGVVRPFQRVVCHPTLRAGEFAGVDRCINQLLEPDAVFVVGNIYARNAVDHIQGGNFANIAAAQFYKKGDTFFVVFIIMPNRIFIDWTDESGVQGQPGPKISLSSLPGVSESLNTGRCGGFGSSNGSDHITRLDLSKSLQSFSGPPKRSCEKHQAQGAEGDDRIAIFNEKDTRTSFIPTEHDKEIGDTLFRELLCFVALYLAYTLLKRFGARYDPNTGGENKRGEDPPNSCV
jgi:hypothetical protein